jgi:anti-anti-sigma regulatory factor
MTAVDAARVPAQVQAEMSLSVLSRPAVTIARLEGELDIATTPALREYLSTLAVLVATQRRARRLGITVRLAAPRPQMTKLLRVTGLDHCFTICATVDVAVPA